MQTCQDRQAEAQRTSEAPVSVNPHPGFPDPNILIGSQWLVVSLISLVFLVTNTFSLNLSASVGFCDSALSSLALHYDFFILTPPK